MSKDTKVKAKCLRFYGEIKLPVKRYCFMEDGTAFELQVTEQGFYLLYGQRNLDTKKLLRCGYFIGMEEGEDDAGRKFVEMREDVPDAPGDYGDGFTEIFRFYPKEECMVHEVKYP